jgi:hypothetical protein
MNPPGSINHFLRYASQNLNVRYSYGHMILFQQGHFHGFNITLHF